jgi:hypothetical protein
MRLYSGGGVNHYAGTRVMVPVTCAVCYYTWQFDAVESGVLPRPGVEPGSGSGSQ